MTVQSAITRRSLVTAIVAGGTIGIAGCAEGPADEDQPAETDETSFPDHPVSEPMAVPEERICDGICGMVVADWPDWNAQIAHENGTGAFFCSPGDMVIYALDPPASDGVDAPITAMWVSEYGTGDLIDAEAAFWVQDDDSSRLEEPMSLNPKPFANRADAEAFVAEYDDLDDSAIIRYDEFTKENVDRYSGHRVPPWEQ